MQSFPVLVGIGIRQRRKSVASDTTGSSGDRKLAIQVKETLVKLGPTFIKLGQVYKAPTLLFFPLIKRNPTEINHFLYFTTQDLSI